MGPNVPILGLEGTVTHREARQKLGSRTRRRAGISGKNTGKQTSKGRALKRRFPVPRKRYVAVNVAKLVKEA